MKSILVLAISLVWAVSAFGITISTVPVGDIGNANDSVTGLGSVGIAYSIGKYEVTVTQYAAFLNAVAKTDTYALYDTHMASDLNVAGITRSGASGNFAYSVTGSANHPITYVGWGDAARFVNWLHNGQPTGAQGNSTTERGAYTLNGANTDATLNAVARNAGALWFLPTNNEWYKAAFYQPAAKGGDTDNYWLYPMKTNSAPYSDQPPGATPNNTRVGNFNQNDSVANGYDDGYATSGLTTYSTSQNYLTDVGAYTTSPSYYNTFDQDGNVSEWVETLGGSSHGARGGGWSGGASSAFSGTSIFTSGAVGGHNDIGFRVAGLPSAAGDFNSDGNVNAADYALWRKNPASYGGSPAGYNTWRSNFGLPSSGSGSGGGLSDNSTVPEPAAFVLASIVGCASTACRRRKSVAHNRNALTVQPQL